MRLVADAREFWREPPGQCLAGKKYLFFCATPDLWGYVMWGHLDETDVRSLAEMVASELAHHVPPHGSYVDIRRVASVAVTFYEVLTEFIQARGADLSSLITQMAVVRPRGAIGAIAEGIATQLSFPHPFAVLTEPVDALRVLGVDERSRRDLVDDLDAIQAGIEGVPPLLRKVRALLEARSGRLPLGEAAKLLAVSTRTLQRTLAELGTSFQHEVNCARVAHAQKLLLGEAKLATIAIEVGCSSLQHFSTIFRRVTGQTPSAWRKAHE